MYQRSRIKRPILTAMLENAGVPRARVYIRNNPRTSAGGGSSFKPMVLSGAAHNMRPQCPKGTVLSGGRCVPSTIANPFPVTQHIREAVVTHGVGHEISHVAQRHNPVMYGYGYGAPVYAAPVVASAPMVYTAPVVAPTNWGTRIAKLLLGPLAW